MCSLEAKYLIIGELVLNYLEGEDLLMVKHTCKWTRDLIKSNSSLKKKLSTVRLNFDKLSNPKKEIKVSFDFQHLRIFNSSGRWSLNIRNCKRCKINKSCKIAKARKIVRRCQNECVRSLELTDFRCGETEDMMHMLGQLPNLESLIFSNSRIELFKSREGVIYPRNLRSLEIRGGNVFLESLFVGDLTSFKFTDRGFLDSFEFEGMI